MFAQCQPWPTVLCEPPVTGCPNTHLSALSGNADHVLPTGSPSPGSTPPAAFPAGRYLESQWVNQHHPTDADAGGLSASAGPAQMLPRACTRAAGQQPSGPLLQTSVLVRALGKTTAIHVQPRAPHPRTGDSWDDYRLQPPIRKVNVLLKRSNC